MLSAMTIENSKGLSEPVRSEPRLPRFRLTVRGFVSLEEDGAVT
jgi:hypothetical protein